MKMNGHSELDSSTSEESVDIEDRIMLERAGYANVTMEDYYAILAKDEKNQKKPKAKHGFRNLFKKTEATDETDGRRKVKMKDKSEILTQFKNCYILLNHAIIREDLWVRNGKICNPEKLFFDEKKGADVTVDCRDAIIAPGFIDVQINGAFGIDFSFDSTTIPKDLNKVAKGLLAHGVTSFCPTVITSKPEEYKRILPHFKKRNGSKDGAGILGLHIEGPFISHEKRGAHLVQCIRQLDGGMRDVLETYGSLDDAAIITLAPELPNANDVIRELVKSGITVSLGHSVASLSEGERAVKSGASFITHLFNAMLPFHHRDPHLVGLLASDQIPDGRIVYYGMISDGIHTHPAALRIAHRTHPKGMVLVTDAIPAMGLPTGIHHFGPQIIEVKGDRAVIAGTDTLCGSIATLNECVQHFIEATGCSKVEALEAASLHPAELLNITDQKGTLDYGTDADFVLLDKDLNVTHTYIAGELVWQKNS